ncbi:hypothetical protein [Enterococcus faecalis]|nr:hypothetical protein [Enterococcus faecalis]MDT2227937.1 hypothetical protein [Enterococcus faecalis]
MWEEIVTKDREISKQRYYPAHTLERMIRADYQIMKTFGVQGRKKKK